MSEMVEKKEQKGAKSSRTWLTSVAAVLIMVLGYQTVLVSKSEIRWSFSRPLSTVVVRDADGSTSYDQDAIKALTWQDALAAETLYLPPVVVLKILSLGYYSVWSDLLFVRAHAYFLTHFFADRRFVWLDNYFEAVRGLDPDNPRIYLWASQVMKYGQHIDDRIIGKSNWFLEEGLKVFPRDWRLHMDLGFNLYFEMVGKDDAEKAEQRLMARDHFAIAAGLPGAPIDPNFVAELFERSEDNSLAVAYALQKYYDSSADQRKQLVRRVGLISEALADGIANEEREWRARFGFMPVSLFALIADSSDNTGELTND